MSEAQTPESKQPDGGESVDELHAGLGGRWLVTTHKGTRHIWCLETMTYQRLPVAGRQRFDYDGIVHPITRVGVYPTVGASSLVFFDDPERPWMEQWRVSSTVAAIARLAARSEAGTDCPPEA
jgi:hypothetical protein